MAVLASGLLLCGLVGCAALPWPEKSRPQLGSPPRAGVSWLDLRGVVHVHTRASHDSPGSIEAVISSARAAGVRWVGLTEHSRPGRPRKSAFAEGVLLLSGYELSAPNGSILALGIESLPERSRDVAKLVRAIHEKGGAAFAGHLERWTDTDLARSGVDGLDGVEVVNLHAQAGEIGRLRLGIRSLFLPRPFALRVLLRPPLENLQRWARAAGAHSAVGGVDAHAKLRVLGPLGGTIDRYGTLFRLVTTHVWASELSSCAVVEALREGRSYVAFEALGRVDALTLEVGPREIRVATPGPARLVLVCDEVEVDSVSDAAAAELTVPPGARFCRVEAWKESGLWIVTSRRAVGGKPSPASRGLS